MNYQSTKGLYKREERKMTDVYFDTRKCKNMHVILKNDIRTKEELKMILENEIGQKVTIKYFENFLTRK